MNTTTESEKNASAPEDPSSCSNHLSHQAQVNDLLVPHAVP
jgi:hypothetical protein